MSFDSELLIISAFPRLKVEKPEAGSSDKLGILGQISSQGKIVREKRLAEGKKISAVRTS